MKRYSVHHIGLRPLAAIGCLSALALYGYGKTFPFPPLIEAVEKATTAANLRAVAARTSDPDVWLGLSFLPQPGDPVRAELCEMAVKAKPEYGPLAIVMSSAMDGVDEQSVAELIRSDPDNALGYYLLANQLFSPGQEKKTLEAFRKGASCSELRLYGGAVSNVLFKALDAMNLKGSDRLCASSWVATRWSNFKILNLQSQCINLQRLAKDADLGTQKELSDLMLALSGHLIGSGFQCRIFGERVLLSAFRLKADIAASEKSPAMNGYAGALQALVSTTTERPWPNTPRAIAPFVPGRIWRAFVVRDPKLAKDHLIEMKGTSLSADPAWDEAFRNWIKTSEGLIGAALPDQDEIIGAYLCGRLPPRTNTPSPWVSPGTYVEALIDRKPNLFKAALANEDATRAINELRQASLSATTKTGTTVADAVTVANNQCIENLRQIAGAKDQWAIEMAKRATDTPSWSDLQPYIGRGWNGVFAKCPSGGAYTIGSVGERPKCTKPGHVCH